MAAVTQLVTVTLTDKRKTKRAAQPMNVRRAYIALHPY
jgi:hypothetical protein